MSTLIITIIAVLVCWYLHLCNLDLRIKVKHLEYMIEHHRRWGFPPQIDSTNDTSIRE